MSSSPSFFYLPLDILISHLHTYFFFFFFFMAANISVYHITIAYLSQVDHAVENMHGNNLEKKDLSAR